MFEKSKKWRSILLPGMILVVSAIFQLGCADKQNQSGKVQLTYWPSTNSFEIKLGRELVAEWNRLHPDTTVALQPLPEGRSGEEVLIIAAAGKTTPDICSNIPPVIVPLLAKADALIPVDRFPDGREYIHNRMPEKLDDTFVSNEGKLYQIPWKGNPILVQYNLGILRDVGIDKLPETWKEWNRVAELVAVDLDGDGQKDRWMADINIVSEWRQRLFDFYTFYIAASGGETLLRHKEVTFNNKTAVSVFRFFEKGFRRGYYAKSIFAGDQFLQNRMAAHITGPWNIAHTENMKPEGFEYAFGPIPVPEGTPPPHYTFGDPKSIGIFSTCEHPEAAWEFVKFITSRTSDLKLMETCQQLPLRRNLTTDTLYKRYFTANPMMLQFAEKVPWTRGFDQSPVLQEVFDAINEQFDACSIQNRISAEDAIKAAVKRSENVLKLRG